jgi:hypothetical protein
MKMHKIIDKIETLDQRYIFVLLFIMVIIPLVHPLGFPIPVSPETQRAYDTIENLPEGSIVLVGNEFTSDSWTELGPSYIAVLKHMLYKNLRLVLIAFFNPEALVSFETMIKPKVNWEGKEYGVDYVDLGFLSGGESAAAAFANNPKVTTVDRYGTPLENLPLMRDITSAQNFSLIVEVDPGAHLPEYMRQFQATFGLKIITITYGVTKSAYIPYLNTGQLSGMVVALTGGAEYEFLIKSPGTAIAGMDAVTTTHIIIAASIIVGNIAYLCKRYIIKKEGKT